MERRRKTDQRRPSEFAPASFEKIANFNGLPVILMSLKKSQGNPDTKVIIVGDTSVGKTSLLTQASTGVFNAETPPTVGALFIPKEIKTSHGRVNLLMWDTAGQERYRSLIPMYLRAASAAILVVDVTSLSSYESVESWYKLIKEKCPFSVRIYVVANKMDLEPQIPLDELQIWANAHRCPFFKSCASWRETVEPIFLKVAEDAGAAFVNAATRTQAVPLQPTQPLGDSDECC
jgi:small GTP-binding protein